MKQRVTNSIILFPSQIVLSGERYPPRRALQRQSKRSTGRIIVILVDIHSIFINFFYNLFPSQRERE